MLQSLQKDRPYLTSHYAADLGEPPSSDLCKIWEAEPKFQDLSPPGASVSLLALPIKEASGNLVPLKGLGFFSPVQI